MRSQKERLNKKKVSKMKYWRKKKNEIVIVYTEEINNSPANMKIIEETRRQYQWFFFENFYFNFFSHCIDYTKYRWQNNKTEWMKIE